MPSAVTTDSGARITKKISSTRSAEVVAASTVPACSAVTVAPPRRPAAPGRPREPRWPGAAPTPAPPTPARARPAGRSGRWSAARRRRRCAAGAWPRPGPAPAAAPCRRPGRRDAGRARLDAQPAEDAAVVVDLVDGGVALAHRPALLGGVFGPLHVDRVGRAGIGAQLAADAALQAVVVAVEQVAAVEARCRRVALLRVLDGVALPEHAPEGDRQTFEDLRCHGAEPLGAGRSSSGASLVNSSDASSRTSTATATRPSPLRQPAGNGWMIISAVTGIHASANGIRTFHPKAISLSKRSRGRVARTQMNRNRNR